MIKSPYQTTLVNGRYQVEQLVLALQRANIEAPFEKMKTPIGNVIRNAFVVTPSSAYDDVSGFTQYIPVPTRDKTTHYVLDARPYMRADRQSNTYRLVLQNDYSLQCIRLALQLQADEKGNSIFTTLGRVPVVTFIRLITHALTNIYQLSLESQIHVSVICAFYYQCLLLDGVELKDSEKSLLAQKISGYTSVPAVSVLDILTEVPTLHRVSDLVDAIRQHSKSLRLKDFTFENLFMLIANTWVGVNSRENVGIALEHLPTWIAMVYSALDERSYRKTILAQRAQSAGKQNDIKYFIDRTFRLVSEQFE